jgi:hypothetical protein
VSLVARKYGFQPIEGSVDASPALRDNNKALWERLTKKRAYVCKVRYIVLRIPAYSDSIDKDTRGLTNYYEHDIIRELILSIFRLPTRGSDQKNGSLWRENIHRFTPLMPLPTIAFASTVVSDCPRLHRHLCSFLRLGTKVHR